MTWRGFLILRITVDHLRGVFAQLGSEQRELFQRTFPEGMPLTEEAMAAAVEAGLDVWVFDDLLTGERLSAYTAARNQAAEISNAATQPAWEALKRAVKNPLLLRTPYSLWHLLPVEPLSASQQQVVEAFLAVKQRADEAETSATLSALLTALREEMAHS